MKKVFIGVGIGCGVLVLLGVIAVGVAGYWVKQKVGGSVESLQQVSQQMAEQRKELAALDQAHPFTPPKEGEMLALSEARLLEYLAVREQALPVFQEFEQKGKALEQKHQGKEGPDLGAIMEATGMLTQLIAQVHAAYIEGLKQHRMSPREYRAITTALYSSLMVGAMEQAQKAGGQAREGMEEALQEVRTRLEDKSLSQEERAGLEAQEQELLEGLADLESQQAEAAQAAPSEEAKAVTAANRALFEKHQARIEKAASLAFDGLILEEEAPGDLGLDNP
jgi:hypothetical protein